MTDDMGRSVDFMTLDVFAARRFVGNPLAVAFDARGMTTDEMVAAAREFNYSESVFALPPEAPGAHARLRIFTPRAEIPFAGHPVIGAVLAFAREGAAFGRSIAERMVVDVPAGRIEATLERDAEGAPRAARIAAPSAFRRIEPIAPETIAACVGLAPEDVVVGAHRPMLASVGLAFAIAEIRSVAALGRAAPRFDAFEAADRRHPQSDDRFSLFLYARTAPGDGPMAEMRVRARMFAPFDGLAEDPATGSASAALGALLADADPAPDRDLRLIVDQGEEMGRPSRIDVTVEKRAGAIGAVFIRGEAVPVMRSRLWL